jgi:TetR/AcrR family transcriptional regulator
MQLSAWFAPPHSDAFKALSHFSGRQQQLLEKLFIKAASDHGNMRGRHRAYAATFLSNTYIGLSLNGYIELNDELTFKAVHQFMHIIFSVAFLSSHYTERYIAQGVGKNMEDYHETLG